MDKFTLSVNESHLEKAIIAAKADNSLATNSCVVAQALKEKFGKGAAMIGFTGAFINGREYRNEDGKAHELTSLVTGCAHLLRKSLKENDKQIRELLPREIEFNLCR